LYRLGNVPSSANDKGEEDGTIATFLAKATACCRSFCQTKSLLDENSRKLQPFYHEIAV